MRNSPYYGIVWGLLVVLVAIVYTLSVRLKQTNEKYEFETRSKLKTEEKLHSVSKELVQHQQLIDQKQEHLAEKEALIARLNEELKQSDMLRKNLERKIAVELGLNATETEVSDTVMD